MLSRCPLGSAQLPSPLRGEGQVEFCGRAHVRRGGVGWSRCRQASSDVPGCVLPSGQPSAGLCFASIQCSRVISVGSCGLRLVEALALQMQSSDGRARPTLSESLVKRLAQCRAPLGLEEDATIVEIIERLVDQCVGLRESAEPVVKRVRGSKTGAERELFSETALSGLGWDVTHLKRREVPWGSADAFEKLNVLSDPLRQLVLLFAETPRSAGDLARSNVVALLVQGLLECEVAREELLVGELALVNSLGDKFFSVLDGGQSLADLSASFAARCPQLCHLLGELVIGQHTAANTRRTPAVKMEWAMILATAIGKVRNVRSCAFAAPLYVVWRSLGVPVDGINVLANLGLSLSAKDGAAKLKEEVEAERRKLARALKTDGAAAGVCVVFDNIDVALGTKSFVKAEVDKRSRLIHVTAASVIHLDKSAATNLGGARPNGPLPLVSLFADSRSQERLTAAVCGVLHEVLHPFGRGMIGCQKLEAPLEHVHFGSLAQSRRQALPIAWLEEGKVVDMYDFAKGVLDRFRPGAQVHFVGDCFSLQKLLAVRELLYGENLSGRADPEDFPIVLVPGWFHLYWNVFLGSLLHSDRDLMELLVETADLRNLKLHKDIGTCFNDVDRIATVLFPVVVVRLFEFFRETVAVQEKINLGRLSEKEVMLRFTLFITCTVKELGSGAGGAKSAVRPVLEWQRYCRVVLLLSVYRSLRVAIAARNHAHMVDVLYFSVSLVCEGPFKQYRKVIIEAVAHFVRSSEAEKERFVQCFTANYSGGALGGRSIDEVREFDNKAVKEALRRNHRSEGDLAPELELTESQRKVTEAFSSAFPSLDSSSGGAIPSLPLCPSVIDIVERAQWPSMMKPLAETVAKKQNSFFDATAHLQMAKETLESLFRGQQFK